MKKIISFCWQAFRLKGVFEHFAKLDLLTFEE